MPGGHGRGDAPGLAVIALGTRVQRDGEAVERRVEADAARLAMALVEQAPRVLVPQRLGDLVDEIGCPSISAILLPEGSTVGSAAPFRTPASSRRT